MAKATLSVIMDAVQGKAGTVVFKKTKDGTIITPRVTPKNPQTPSQQAVRSAMTTATRQWKNFTPAQVAAWEKYAADNAPDYDSGINAFVQLATKWILVNGSGPAPTAPPTSAFTGDTIKLNMTVGTGKLTYTANAANASGVTTELMFQSLKSQNRKPQKGAYRVGTYFPFTSGSLSKDVNVPAGYYAAGYRFVKVATGQTTPFVSIAVPGPVTLSVTANDRGSSSSKKAA